MYKGLLGCMWWTEAGKVFSRLVLFIEFISTVCIFVRAQRERISYRSCQKWSWWIELTLSFMKAPKKKYWIPPACSILRNSFHLNNQTLVFYEIEGFIELLINFTCLLIQTRKQHLGTIFRYALFVWSAAREKWNFVSDNRKWHLRGFKNPKFSGGTCPQTPLEERAARSLKELRSFTILLLLLYTILLLLQFLMKALLSYHQLQLKLQQLNRTWK